MKKKDFKKMFTNRSEKMAMKILKEKKANHSKVKTLKHENRGIQKYLKHYRMKITIEERQAGAELCQAQLRLSWDYLAVS